MIQTHTDQLVESTRDAIQGLRVALIELFGQAGVNAAQPVEVAKAIGFHKNLAWRISRVISASDPFAALAHMPGTSGFEIAIAAFERANVSASAVAAAREALRRFDEVVDHHAGDRAHLELILDSMGLLGNENRLESSREMFFKGASGLWGVQARTRLMSVILAPSKTSADYYDAVMVAGFMGFRRLRPTATWRLFRYQYSDEKQPVNGKAPPTPPSDVPYSEPLDTNPGEHPMLLRRFCSANMPPIEAVRVGDKVEHYLAGGPVGNAGTFDCTVGNITRNLPGYATPEDATSSFASSVSLPVEQLVFDIIVHRERPLPTPEVRVFGFPHGGPDDPSAQQQRNLLPISGEFEELAGSPPAVTTPSVPRYAEIAQSVYERLGYRPAEFRGIRMVMPYPPMNSMVVARWDLPKRT
ncbi:MAG: hypothetical protein HBSAPP03_20220 [Phycisphaerae bacterium]|nr:MAG: hypothetical protein HBSAPP03_20220 [Phycisphaerae bacterium]